MSLHPRTLGHHRLRTHGSALLLDRVVSVPNLVFNAGDFHTVLTVEKSAADEASEEAERDRDNVDHIKCKAKHQFRF